MAGLLVAATVASFGINWATRRPPAPPPGLLLATGGGFTTRYRQWGTAGPTVVLVPGAFETADTYAPLGQVLGTDHRVYAIDLTGTGYSTPAPPFSAATMARQLLAFLDTQGLSGPDAPVLVGHSSGAAVVGLAGVSRPGGVRAVVFLDGDALPLRAPAAARFLLPDPYRTTLLRLGLRSGRLVGAIYQRQCGPTCPRLSPDDLDRWRRPLQQPGFEAQLRYQLAHGIPAMTGPELDQLAVSPPPKLVIAGVDDPVLAPAAAEAVARRIGAPPPVEIPGRHLTMISSPAAIADALRTLPG